MRIQQQTRKGDWKIIADSGGSLGVTQRHNNAIIAEARDYAPNGDLRIWRLTLTINELHMLADVYRQMEQVKNEH